MATPVLDALLSGNMSDKRGLADSLGRLRSVGSLLQGGSSQNQAMGVGLENEANERAEQLRQVGESNRDNLARLRSAQIGAAAKMASASAKGPKLGKWTSYIDEKYGQAAQLGRDVNELQTLMDAVEAEGGDIVQPVAEIMKSWAGGVVGEKASDYLAKTVFKSEAQRRLAVKLNQIDSNIRKELYGSALTASEIGYSLGNLLEGATTPEDLRYRIENMGGKAARNLKRIEASYETNPYIQDEIDSIIGGGRKENDSAGPEPTPTGEYRISPDGVRVQMMSDGNAVEVQ